MYRASKCKIRDQLPPPRTPQKIQDLSRGYNKLETNYIYNHTTTTMRLLLSAAMIGLFGTGCAAVQIVMKDRSYYAWGYDGDKTEGALDGYVTFSDEYRIYIQHQKRLIC